MNLKQKIIRELREAIINKIYNPGEHLTELALSKQFQVSRTPVREALNQLEKEGFIQIIPGIGAKVTKLSLEQVFSIYDVLIILEGASSNLACTKISDKQIAELEKCNKLFEEAIHQENLESLFELNARFHWLITEATQNSYLIEIRSNFRFRVDPIARIFPTMPNQCRRSLEEHGQILDALRARDPSLAESAMRNHLEEAKKALRVHLTQSKRNHSAIALL